MSHSSVCDIFIILVKAPAHYYIFIDTKVNIVNFELNRIVIHFEIIRELVDCPCYDSLHGLVDFWWNGYRLLQHCLMYTAIPC